MIEWIQVNEVIFWWLTGLSLVTFIAALLIVPFLVVRIPSDYFSGRKRSGHYKTHHYLSVPRLLLLIVKNAIGGLLVLAGIVMLVLPGQGVLTILIGIAIMNFPGKFRLERWIVSRGPTLWFINRLRRRRGRPPLVLDSASESKGKK